MSQERTIRPTDDDPAVFTVFDKFIHTIDIDWTESRKKIEVGRNIQRLGGKGRGFLPTSDNDDDDGYEEKEGLDEDDRGGKFTDMEEWMTLAKCYFLGDKLLS